MRLSALTLALPILTASADPSLRLEVMEKEAWTGQRVRFFIELQADGTFAGAPSFDLPEIPRSIIIKVGNPIIGSATEGDTEVFTQRHEFALFSQASGALQVPPIGVRFSHHIGYTGPTHDVRLTTEPASFTLKRPPGSEEIGFLVTTENLTIEESWDPAPGPVETGAVFKRTIKQHATELTGMALAPAPDTAPDGVRSYPASPVVTDHTERGELDGSRSETITYLVQQPGLHELPAIRYDWWNPKTEKLESKTLPAVSFTATAPPPPPVKPSPARFLWLLLPVGLIAALVLLRKPIVNGLHRLREILDPPPRRTTRHFLHACRADDPKAAIAGWSAVRAASPELRSTTELESELRELHRHLYGEHPDPSWSGAALAQAFREASRQHPVAPERSPLPPLNPGSR